MDRPVRLQLCSKLGALWAYYADGAVTGATGAYVCNNRVIAGPTPEVFAEEWPLA